MRHAPCAAQARTRPPIGCPRKPPRARFLAFARGSASARASRAALPPLPSPVPLACSLLPRRRLGLSPALCALRARCSARSAASRRLRSLRRPCAVPPPRPASRLRASRLPSGARCAVAPCFARGFPLPFWRFRAPSVFWGFCPPAGGHGSLFARGSLSLRCVRFAHIVFKRDQNVLPLTDITNKI